MQGEHKRTHLKVIVPAGSSKIVSEGLQIYSALQSSKNMGWILI